MSPTSTSEPSWSLHDYCASQRPFAIHALSESSRGFFARLSLPVKHPYCSGADDVSTLWRTISNSTSSIVEQPLLASSLHHLHDGSFCQKLVTWFWQTVPPYSAFLELWLRLLAGYVAPLAILYLMSRRRRRQHHQQQEKPERQRQTDDGGGFARVISLLAAASSSIIMTDSM